MQINRKCLLFFGQIFNIFFRAYRLVLIIANQWFNYYREWRSEQPRFNREEFEKDNKAYEIWSRKKGIIEFQTEDGRRAWKIVNV